MARNSRTAIAATAERVDITTDPAALSHFTGLIHPPCFRTFAEALLWLSGSRYFVTADALSTIIKGEQPAGTNAAGKPRSMWEFLVEYLGIQGDGSERLRAGPHLRDGPVWHFDGRPPSPVRHLRQDKRAAYQLHHLDMFQRFEEALKLIIAGGFIVDQHVDCSAELRAYIESHVRPHQREHFTWKIQ